MTFKRTCFTATLALSVVIAVSTGYLLLKTPSHDRSWKKEYAELPSVERAGDSATIRNVRDFSYGDDGTIVEARYHDVSVSLGDLTSVWYGISHFQDYGLAHTFLSFGFGDGRYLAISVEARQEIGESYGPIDGLLRSYELIYLVGEERDIIGLRTHIRKERVLLYQLNLDAVRGRALLEDMLASVDRIHREPTFYNTLTDNCTTNIVQHAEGVSAFDRLTDYRILLPGYSDGLAVEIGAVVTSLPLDQLREKSRLDPQGIMLDDPDFSTRIRRHLLN